MLRAVLKTRAGSVGEDDDESLTSGVVALAANRRQCVSWVAVVTRLDLGGGRSMPTDRSSVALNMSLSTWEEVRRPIGQRGDADGHLGDGRARSRTQTPSPRGIRVGDPASWRASMEREMSTTTKASASVRVRKRCPLRHRLGGRDPRKAPAAITATTATSRCRAEGVAGPGTAPLGAARMK
jgi:hypothetical protein